ncbi:ABC-type cobalt transport system, permease component CbiQ and related transporters [Pelotomaculum thermopropionicum SI]|uniref:ABC-type cobalt transport system, permease component CbiQ and related transporters n=1 Tax=Pelotomaculum thermopropionicum (strain DSM 13744 / JCM 10971 / SI) TaxID=370438 RepID=A5D1N4_PELTS|nr:ABC-type cobalt transport system, permease component CbiQ and related transporters [Pelotomaculum thermopropionicum SI]
MFFGEVFYNFMEGFFAVPGAKWTSAVHKMDARVKVTVVFGFVALTSALNSPLALAAAATFLLLLAVFSRMPACYLLKKLVWIIPFGGIMIVIFPFITPGAPVFELKAGFIALTASDEGVKRAGTLFIRVFSAVLALSILTATTGFRALMDAFRQLRVPPVLVALIEFTVRYMFVLADELQRMRTARAARCFDGGGSLVNRHVIKTIGQLVGVLFVRSWERGERVYSAMLARGYSGQVEAAAGRALCFKDVWAGVLILAFVAGLYLIELGGRIWQISLK